MIKKIEMQAYYSTFNNTMLLYRIKHQSFLKINMDYQENISFILHFIQTMNK